MRVPMSRFATFRTPNPSSRATHLFRAGTGSATSAELRSDQKYSSIG